MKSTMRYLRAAMLLLLWTNPSFAQQPPPAPDKAAEKPKEEKKPPTPEEKIVQTKHSLKVGGQEIKYTATPFPGKRRNNSTVSRKTWSPSRISSGSMPRATSAGLRQNSWLAKATAPRAPLAFPVISSSVTACISTASS